MTKQSKTKLALPTLLLLNLLIGSVLCFQVTKAQTTDTDNDGVTDNLDNCPTVANSAQIDSTVKNETSLNTLAWNKTYKMFYSVVDETNGIAKNPQDTALGSSSPEASTIITGPTSNVVIDTDTCNLPCSEANFTNTTTSFNEDSTICGKTGNIFNRLLHKLTPVDDNLDHVCLTVLNDGVFTKGKNVVYEIRFQSIYSSYYNMCLDNTSGAACTSAENHTSYYYSTSTIGDGIGDACEGTTQQTQTTETTQEGPTCSGQISINTESGQNVLGQQCMEVNVEKGNIFFSHTPDSFNFPKKYRSEKEQDNFSNPSGTTGPNQTLTPSGSLGNTQEDLLTVTDLRYNGGFKVTIQADPLSSGINEIPLTNLYTIATIPTLQEIAAESTLRGTTKSGILYSQNSQGLQDLTNSVFSEKAVNLPNTYTDLSGNKAQFQSNTPIELMTTTTPHTGSFSESLSYYLKIPANQPAGLYGTVFTIDLITQ